MGLAEASIELTSKRERNAYLAGKGFIPEDDDTAAVGFPDMIMSAELGCIAAAAVLLILFICKPNILNAQVSAKDAPAAIFNGVKRFLSSG